VVPDERTAAFAPRLAPIVRAEYSINHCGCLCQNGPIFPATQLVQSRYPISLRTRGLRRTRKRIQLDWDLSSRQERCAMIFLEALMMTLRSAREIGLVDVPMFTPRNDLPEAARFSVKDWRGRSGILTAGRFKVRSNFAIEVQLNGCFLTGHPISFLRQVRILETRTLPTAKVTPPNGVCPSVLGWIPSTETFSQGRA